MSRRCLKARSVSGYSSRDENRFKGEMGMFSWEKDGENSWVSGSAKQEKRNVSYIVGDWLGHVLEIRVRTALQGLSMRIWVAPEWGGIIMSGKMGATVR